LGLHGADDVRGFVLGEAFGWVAAALGIQAALTDKFRTLNTSSRRKASKLGSGSVSTARVSPHHRVYDRRRRRIHSGGGRFFS
jgi:hypothetical protein